jgi:membrane protein YqaA with SNARE-associated domain
MGKLDWIEKYLHVSQNKLNKGKRFVERYSSLTAFFTWVPGIGDVMAIGLGLFKINLFKVFLFMTLGKFARYYVIIFIMQLIVK